MSAWSRTSTRALRDRRLEVGVSVLGMLVLCGAFAELLAGPAPVVALGPGGFAVLPGVVHPARYAHIARESVEAEHGKDVVLWPVLRYGPLTPTEAGPNARPSVRHPLGTDALGHDLSARLIYGARFTLAVSFATVLSSLALGIALGGFAGHEKRRWSGQLSRLVETIHTFPAVLLVALLQGVNLLPRTVAFVIAVVLVRAAEVATLLRLEISGMASDGYVLSAFALGAPPTRVFYRHLLPNAAPPIMASAVFSIGSVVLLDTALTFLGLGQTGATASWGEMLAEGAGSPRDLRMTLLPAALATVLVASTHLIATAFVDAQRRTGGRY